MTGWQRDTIPQWTEKVSFSIQSLESYFAFVDKAVEDSPSGNIYNRLDYAQGRFNKLEKYLSSFDEVARHELLRKGFTMALDLVAQKREANQQYDSRLYEKQQDHEHTVSN